MAKAAWRTKGKTHDTPSTFAPSEKKPRMLDPISNLLGANEDGYFYKMRWAWFTQDIGGLKYPLEVTRFYHTKNIAIDISSSESADIRATKKALLESKGIQYVTISSDLDLRGLKEGVQ